MEPLELIEHENVVGFWFDETTPDDLVRDAEARAVARLSQEDRERQSQVIEGLKGRLHEL